MRMYEIISEVRLDPNDFERAQFLQVMYGAGVTTGDMDRLDLEAKRIENERSRIEVVKLARDVARADNPDDLLAFARTLDVLAAAAAKLGKLDGSS